MAFKPANQLQIFESFSNPSGPWSLLEVAANSGDAATVVRLLDNFPGGYKPGGFGKTLLHRASARGHVSTMKVLFDYGAQVEEKDDSGWTALHWAAARNRTHALLLLLELGANINSTNNTGETPLHLAAMRDHAEAVRLLLGNKGKAKMRNDLGKTPLHSAATTGADDVLSVLLKKGGEPNSVAEGGWTALHWAASGGYASTVRLLLASGANVNAVNDDGITPLHWAAGFSHLDSEYHEDTGRFLALRRLKGAGASVNAKDIDGLTPLHWVNGKFLSAKTMFFLLAHGAAIDKQIPLTRYQLHRAADNGDANSVLRLINEGFDPDEKDSWGWTPLHWAAVRNHAGTVQVLLEQGADHSIVAGHNLNLWDYWIWGRRPDWKKLSLTPLDMASASGSNATAELLLSASYLEPDQTVLSHAARNGHLATVRLFYNHGYKLEYVTKAVYGEHADIVQFVLESEKQADLSEGFLSRALYLAVVRGDMEITELLVKYGVNINSRIDGGWSGNTPLHWAAMHGHENIVQLLLALGADVNAKNVGWGTEATDRTPLHWAAKEGHERIAKLLLNHGADIKVQDYRGRTPLHAASYGWKRWQIAPLLIRRGALVTEPIVNTSFRSPWRAYLKKQAKSPRLIMKWGKSIEIRQASGEEYSMEQLSKIKLQAMGNDGFWHPINRDSISWDVSLPMIRAVYTE